MADNVLLEGERLRIEFAIRANGKMPAKEFYDSELSDSERRKLRPPMVRLAQDGRVSNREHFKKVKDELWEFKSYQVRLIGFFLTSGAFALAYGIRKKQDRLSKADVKTAEEIRKEYLQIVVARAGSRPRRET
jgi:Phage derived protein Gp49-like (DUF891)